MKIISRTAWGAEPWRGTVHTSPPEDRDWFLVHYHGGKPRNDRGDANAKEIEGIHLGNGWSGIGYNFIVGQDGAIREGRGWNLVGAHCPGRNRDGYGVYVAVGEDQEPSEAAKAAVVWLYEEACRKAGKSLTASWHGAHYATSCAGGPLIAWVKAGMPVDGTVVEAPKAEAPKKTAPAKTVWGPGDKGAKVKEIQKIVGVPADGIYGAQTKSAVLLWQRARGLSADGIWGPQSEANKSRGPLKTGIVGGRPARVPAFPGLTKRGSRGAAVQAVQERLKDRGWSVAVDGIFGADTEAVVRSFQKEKGLAADGIVGSNTWTALWKAAIT